MARFYRGTINYISEAGGEFGREYFSVSVERDGTRTLRCVCEMDNVALVRDVTYTVDANFLPIDCYVRVSNDHKFVGSGWFRFTDTGVDGEVETVAEGRVTQHLPTPGRARLFGTHPICIDIWKCAHVQAARPGEVQLLDNCVNSSSVPNGASGPLLARKSYDMVYQGREQVTVKSGTFDCQYFHWRTGTGRTLQLYTATADYLPVKTVVPEGKRYYELVEFEELNRAV
ncbi:MAG: hypothetical protein SFV21_03270 [Rhodospirillaceae bacterium]|nr:hypothetical protein [Rhodospirillaceae bacterium]